MTHRPVLSIVAFITAPISSVFFCYNIFCRKWNTAVNKRPGARARALLHKKRKREEEEKRRREQEDEGVRWRGQRPHDRDDSDDTEEEIKEDNKNK